jgi:hypothetical protein
VREEEQSQREKSDIGIENGFHRSDSEKNIAQFPAVSWRPGRTSPQ